MGEGDGERNGTGMVPAGEHAGTLIFRGFKCWAFRRVLRGGSIEY